MVALSIELFEKWKSAKWDEWSSYIIDPWFSTARRKVIISSLHLSFQKVRILQHTLLNALEFVCGELVQSKIKLSKSSIGDFGFYMHFYTFFKPKEN